MRIGYGFAAARTKEKDDRYIILAGKKLDWRVGVLGEGECDRDVAALAAADALLGAVGLGCLKNCTAQSFDTANTAGMELLAQAARLVEERGFRLGNMDLLILAQDVRFARHVPEMKANLCAALGCGEDRLNLKADHEQWLGYTGSCDGINARAVCLLEEA